MTFSTKSTTLKRVLIAPGFRRCGTSSLHTVLRENRTLLHPYFDIHARSDLTKVWRNNVRKIYTNGKAKHIDRLAGIAEVMAHEVDPGPSGNAVVADENLVGFSLYYSDGRTIFDVAQTVLPIIEQAFAGVDVHFRFQIRDWDGWIKSSYAREVRNRGATYSMEEYTAGMCNTLNWEKGLSQIKGSLTSPVSFVDLSQDLVGGMPGKSIFEHFGVPDDVIQKLQIPRRKNVSPSAPEIEKLRLQNMEAASHEQTS